MTPIADLARGRWKHILPALGIESGYLSGKHGPCPLCKDGKDRWRFDDKDGTGSFFCSHCGAGAGIKLVMLKTGLDFKAACAEVEKHINGPVQPAKPQRTAEAKQQAMKRLWDSAVPLTLDNPAGRYIANRTGLRVFPKCLRYAERCAYRRDDGSNVPIPALLGAVQALDGSLVNLMRIWTTASGIKADLPDAKRTMEGTLPPGSAVRLLSPVDGVLGIGTGIETSLAAAVIFNVPVWAALNDNRLEVWTPPVGITKVMIFGDNDLSFSGQAASYALARRLVGPRHKIEAEVYIPEMVATDWADVLVQLSRVA